jgi:hypothetical protein
MVAAGDVDGALPFEGIELAGLARQRRGDLRRVVLAGRACVTGDGGPREGEPGVRLLGNLGHGDVAYAVGEAGVWQSIAGPAALLVESEGVRAGEGHRDAVVYEEGKGRAEAGDNEAVFPGRRKVAKVRLEHALVGRGGRPVARVPPGRQGARVHRLAGERVYEREPRRRGYVHLAHVAQVVADHRLFRERRNVAFLVHVDRRAVAVRVARGGCGAGRFANLNDLRGPQRVDGVGEPDVELRGYPQVAPGEGRIDHPAL